MDKRIIPMPLLLLATMVAGSVAQAQEGASSGTPQGAALERHIMLTPEAIDWGECPPSLPGGAQCSVIEGDPAAQGALFALRLKMPDGYRIQPHFHSSDEHVVVLSGTFHMAKGETFDANAGQAHPAGGFMAMPAGERHYAWSSGETEVHIYAIGPWTLTYVDPQHDPRRKTAATD